MKFLRKCIVGLFAVFALLCILIVALPDRQVKSLAIAVTHLLTDRQLRIGTFELERSLTPRLTLSDITFSNPAWANGSSLFAAKRIDVSVQLPRLLKGHLAILDAKANGIELHLEKSVTGENNWQLSADPKPLSILARLTIVGANINNTLVTYLDNKTSMSQRLMLAEVSVTNEETNAKNPEVIALGEINELPISATLSVQATEPGSVSILEAVGLPYQLALKAGDIQMSAIGQLNDVEGASLLKSDVFMNMASLTQLGNVINQPLPDIGPVELSATLTVSPETVATTGLQIPSLLLRITDPQLQLEAQGQFSDIPATSSGTIDVTIEIPDTDAILAMFNSRRRLPGVLNANATLSGSNKVYDLELKRSTFASEFIDAVLSGTVTDVLNTASADVSVKLDTPDLSLVTQLFGTRMPPEWGPWTATASLQGESGLYALNNIDATLNANSKANARGSINSLVPFDDMHLDVEANLFTLAEVSTFTKKTPLPDLGPINGAGVVGWKDGYLYLQNSKFNHNSELGIAVVTGKIGDLIRFDKVRLRADADLPNFAALDLFTGFELPDVDHVVASTNLISANARDISARQLKVTTTLDGVTVVGTGAVESFIKRYISVDLDLESRVDSLSQLNSLTGTTLPELGPLEATAMLVGRGKQFSVKDINATLNDKQLAGTLSSQIDDFARLDQLTFDVNLQTDNIANAAEKLGFNSPIDAPATLSSRVRLDGSSLHFDNTDVDVKGNRANANLAVLNVLDKNSSNKITGDITLLNVDMVTMSDKTLTSSDTNPGGNPSQEDSKTGPLFSDAPLPLHVLQNKDIDLNLQIRDFTSNLLDISNASLKVVARDDTLRIGQFTGTVNEGKVDLSVVVDAQSNPAKVDANVDLGQFNLARTMLLDGTELIRSNGSTWASMSFAGEGNSLADIMGSATGEGGAYISDLLLTEDVLTILSSDLINQLADALNPFDEKTMMETQLLCTALTFQIQNGMLQTPFGFATEAKDFSVVGDAMINLKNETLDVMFNSKPKTGLGLSLNRLAGLVKLEGPITSPSLMLSEKGLLQFGASVAAAVASSGITLLAEGLYNKIEARSDVCARALGN